jgi:glycosyltransferase involved in cell wall biosynthesis
MAYRLTSSIAGLAAARKGGLDVRLVVAGGAAPEVLLQAHRLADRLEVSDGVIFAGPYRRAEAPAVYRGADAYLITTHNDACPNVVLEALASGLPVLYAASGGVPELVGEEAGVGLAVPDTFEATPAPLPAAVAEGMAKVIAGRDRMGPAARTRSERFDIGAWIDRHRRLFADLVGAAPA